MPKRLLIFCVTSSVVNYHKNDRKPAYGVLNNRKTMYLICFIGVWCGLVQSSGVFAEFPGLRKPPTNWVPTEEKDVNSELLALARIRAIWMEHNARLKLMQQLEQITREKEMLEREQSYPIEESNSGKIEEIPDVFDYPSNVDTASKDNLFSKMNTQFAYGPKDPRYWMTEPYKPRQFIKTQQPSIVEYEMDVEDEPTHDTKITKQQMKQPTDAVPTFNVKAPMIPKPKLQSTKQGTTIDNNHNNNEQTEKVPEQKGQQSVVQKPIKLDDGIGIYVVAMIAGVSAAITVAVIAVGLGWYTLRQKIKAAADLDYPAYGVTGPNKDLLYPSNDKKFAQSVDMYHYQQQKQKKLSLENKSNGETNDGFSDLDGEFDMDDGDYTVYECPGFAPTGEMEVKNPLFADEPITVAQKHQPSSETTEDVTQFVETTDEKKQQQQRSPNNNKHGKKSPKNISPNKDKTTSKKK